MRKLKFNRDRENNREKKPNTNAGKFWKRAGMIAAVLTSATSVFAVGAKPAHALVNPVKVRSSEKHTQIILGRSTPKATKKMVTKQLTIKVIPAGRLRRELGRSPAGPAFIDKGKLVFYTPVSNNNFLVARIDPSLGSELSGITRKMINKYFQNPKASTFDITIQVKAPPAVQPSLSTGISRRHGRLPGSGFSVTPASPRIGVVARSGGGPSPTTSKEGLSVRTVVVFKGKRNGKRESPFVSYIKGAKKAQSVHVILAPMILMKKQKKLSIWFNFVVSKREKSVKSTDVRNAIPWSKVNSLAKKHFGHRFRPNYIDFTTDVAKLINQKLR